MNPDRIRMLFKSLMTLNIITIFKEILETTVNIFTGVALVVYVNFEQLIFKPFTTNVSIIQKPRNLLLSTSID